jgi:uncharacterized surface protein with fasciclin (FAS1) repeats
MRLGRRIAAAVAASTAVAGIAIGMAAPATALSPAETKSFLDQLTATYSPTGDSNPYDFDIVTRAALLTGADKTLASLNTFTLFAPNDRAFEVLANSLGLLGTNYTFGPTVNEARVFDALLTLPNAGATITEILLYHVFPGGKVTGAQVLSGPFSQRLDMANGEKLRVTVLSRSASFPVIVLGDKDGKLFNDLVVKSKIDVIKTDNTVVHGISDVLLPDLTN